MQSQYAFHDQHWFGRNVVPAIYAQVPRKVVDGSLDGLACGIIPNLLLQQLDVDGIRRVVVLLGSFLQRKMVHLNGEDFHRDNMSIEMGSHALGHRRFAAAGRTSESNDADPYT